MQIRVNVKIETFKVNRIVRYFVLADLFFLGGWGLINPIFSIFIIERIMGATIFTVGVVFAIQWTIRSLAQIPVALYLDRHDGEKDDFYVLIVSLMLSGFVSLLYLAVGTIPSLFAAIFLQGLTFALYTPSWNAIFSRHLDADHYALDWSFDNIVIGLASGVAAFVGGSLAKFLGFDAVFIFASVLSFISAAILLLVPNLVLPRGAARELLSRKNLMPLDFKVSRKGDAEN